MKTIPVQLQERSYPIYIGSGLLGNAELIQKHIANRQVMIVTSEKVAPLYLETVQACFKGIQCDVVILPDGEANKSLTVLEQIFSQLIEKKHHRSTTLVALGGGMIGDMTGFAAACYQRGVNFLQIPTTLFAQVDASVGGKTAVNHKSAKNMIGAFYQPQCVITDINTLATLSDRELRAGIAEIIKSALIQDEVFVTWLEDNMEALLERNEEALVYAIAKACEIKADIVSQDECERGVRAHLNLGHTFGHALEQNVGYGTWLHGEAVAVGCILAADLSSRLGWLEKQDVSRVKNLIIQAKLPTTLPHGLEVSRLLDTMAVDKKMQDSRLRFVLLRALGKAEVNPDVSGDAVEAVISSHSGG